MEYFYYLYLMANGTFFTAVLTFAIANILLEKIVMIKERRFNAKDSALDLLINLSIIIAVFLVRVGFNVVGREIFSEVILWAIIGHYVYAIAINFKSLGFTKVYEAMKGIKDLK